MMSNPGSNAVATRDGFVRLKREEAWIKSHCLASEQFLTDIIPELEALILTDVEDYFFPAAGDRLKAFGCY
ncbi:hypothetical protein ASD03_23330 [Ensifer sp. Root127]|nr:hypothetical protein ASD03_23330 [Ensifer sp. Root127]